MSCKVCHVLFVVYLRPLAIFTDNMLKLLFKYDGWIHK